jgi:hypothetical protein
VGLASTCLRVLFLRCLLCNNCCHIPCSDISLNGTRFPTHETLMCPYVLFKSNPMLSARQPIGFATNYPADRICNSCMKDPWAWLNRSKHARELWCMNMPSWSVALAEKKKEMQMYDWCNNYLVCARSMAMRDDMHGKMSY